MTTVQPSSTDTLAPAQPTPNRAQLQSQVVQALGQVLPAHAILFTPEDTTPYECDGLTAYRERPLVVTLPETSAQVQAVLQTCHRLNVPVVARGAGTGLSGGAMPHKLGVTLSMAKFNQILRLDPISRTAVVQCGVRNLAISEAAAKHGLYYAPDPSSQIACTIGGNIGMNSGGAHCLKYGVTTNNLLGVTLVTMQGEVLQIGGPYLDAGGLDLLGVICGSEGQLGVVTEAWLRILPKPEGARPVLMGFASNEVAGACVSDIIKGGLLPVAIEFMDRPCIEATEAFAHAGYPDCEALLIVEVEGSPAEIDDQLARIKTIAARHDPVAYRESRSEDEAKRIWLGRKSAFGAMGQMGDYICLDGTIPVSELSHVLRRIGELSDSYGLRVANVFHAGDGNMHPLIIFNANKPGDLELAEALGADILRLCVEVGGCLTGEHGVGVEKRDLMHVQFTPDDMEAQLRVKDVFDPAWLLNPAKVFPLDVTASRRAA